MYKTLVTVTVLSDAPLEETGVDDLQALGYEMDEGDFVGSVHWGHSVLVPLDERKGELLAVGNDGTFFDREDEEEED